MKRLFLLVVSCVLLTTGCSFSKVNEDINCTMEQDSSIYKTEAGIKMSVKDSSLQTSIITVDIEYKDSYLKYFTDDTFKSMKESLDVAYAQFKDYEINKTDKGLSVEVRLTVQEILDYIGRGDEVEKAKKLTKEDVEELKTTIESQGYTCK